MPKATPTGSPPGSGPPEGVPPATADVADAPQGSLDSEPQPEPGPAVAEPGPAAAEPAPAPEPPPKLAVMVKGIDSELDASGKEYIVFTFGLSIGHERVHTIQDRYSELSRKYKDIPSRLPGCPAKFPGKHVSITGSKDMKGDNTNINLRSRELCEFFTMLLVDTDFKHGEKMAGVHELMEISPEISKRLIAAAKERSTWDRDNDEDLVAGKKSGWLHKQGSLVKNWKRRWFVLDYPHLRYYASPEDTTPKGEINCTEVTLTEKHAVAVGREHCFAMYHPDRRTFFLQSEDEDQMMRWVQAIRHNSAKVSAIDFEEKALIGQGNFGKVLLVRHKRTDGFYAMKIMSKDSLRRQDVEHTKTERSVLQALAGGVKHPFVVKLNFAFQTPGAAGKLYMVMDYVPGGDLYYHLRRRRRFSEDVVKVWAAELSDAIGYVHSLGIVFRDLKLENLLLDGQGHVHLADFGLSKQVDVAELSSYRLRTFCGTPFYMAPELVKTQRSRRGQRSAGYTKEVDWWAVGVIIFELLTGNPPFNAQSMQELYRKIAEHPIPDVLAELKRNSEPSVQEPMANLVRDLLTRDPDARLGHGEADRDAVRLHMAFEGWCDWERLLRKEIESPYKPDISDATDISNFDPTFTRKKFRESEALPTSEQVAGEQTADPFNSFTYVGGASPMAAGDDVDLDVA